MPATAEAAMVVLTFSYLHIARYHIIPVCLPHSFELWPSAFLAGIPPVLRLAWQRNRDLAGR